MLIAKITSRNKRSTNLPNYKMKMADGPGLKGLIPVPS